MSPNAPRPWLGFPLRPGWMTGMFRGPGWLAGGPAISALRAGTAAFTKTVRSLAEQRAAAEETAKALDALPESRLRRLTAITVRCPSGKLLLRVVRIPDHLPGARYDRHLVIPSSATSWLCDDGQQRTARAWFLAEHDETLSVFGVRCRCHPEVTLTSDQLLGESPSPPGIRVLRS